MESENTIFDREQLLKQTAHDQELANEVMNIFFEDTPGLIASIKEAVNTGDRETAILNAHSIKGSSSNIGAGQLCRIAYEIEMAGQDGDLETVLSKLPELEDAFERVKAEVETA